MCEQSDMPAVVEHDMALHRIIVEAPGHEVAKQNVELDDDRSLSIRLERRVSKPRPSDPAPVSTDLELPTYP